MQPRNLKWMKIWILVAAMAAAGLVMMGCTQPDTLEKDFGVSVHNNTAQQVVNPQAGLKSEPTVGLSPKAAENEMDRYEKGFTGTAPPPTPYMGITGAAK